MTTITNPLPAPVAVFDIAVNERVATIRYNYGSGGLVSGDHLFTAAALQAYAAESSDAEIAQLRADAARWVALSELVNNEQASVTFMGRMDSIHTGIEVFDSGDLHDEIDAAMEGRDDE